MTISSATLDSINGKTAATKAAAADDPGSQDRFLKLLVTQLQNQDPLSPMDNAQLTSQIAQINTVTGLPTLNSSVEKLSGQFLQSQTVQGASLIGKNVIVPGNRVDIAAGSGQGGFELASAADAVKVEVLSPAGQVVGALDLGAQSSGVHSFDWPAGSYADSANLTFRVSASSGATVLGSTALMRDKVSAVSTGTSGGELTLQLQRSGATPYSSIRSID